MTTFPGYHFVDSNETVDNTEEGNMSELVSTNMRWTLRAADANWSSPYMHIQIVSDVPGCREHLEGFYRSYGAAFDIPINDDAIPSASVCEFLKYIATARKYDIQSMASYKAYTRGRLITKLSISVPYYMIVYTGRTRTSTNFVLSACEDERLMPVTEYTLRCGVPVSHNFCQH